MQLRCTDTLGRGDVGGAPANAAAASMVSAGARLSRRNSAGPDVVGASPALGC